MLIHLNNFLYNNTINTKLCFKNILIKNYISKTYNSLNLTEELFESMPLHK